ncbi:MAG: YdcF family protein, partial [Rhodanobacter sp.]
RLRRALSLAGQRQTDHLLLLGGYSGGQCSEAAAGQAWLQRHGLARGVRVELEQDSVDSLENLRHARRLLLAEAGDAGLPPVALVTSRYHLARCLLLARRLGFDGLPVAAEPALPRQRRYLGLLLLEASYLMWIDLGLRWAQLIGHRRMAARIS